MRSFSQKVSAINQGINYLIPQYWFRQFQEINDHHGISNIHDLYFPQLNLNLHVDNILLQYQQQIKAELNHLCNNIGLNKIIISPEPSLGISWRPIPPQLWKAYQNYNKSKTNKIAIYTYISQSQDNKSFQKQIRIVFNNKSNKFAFVGYFSQDIYAVKLIRALAQQLGIKQSPNDKITIVGNSQKSYSFSQIEHLQVRNLSECVLLIDNVQRSIQQTQSRASVRIKQQVIIERMDEQITNERPQIFNDGNQSTGLDMSYMNEELYYPEQSQGFKPFRAACDLLKNKKPEDILILKKKAKQAIRGQLLNIPISSKQQLEESLQNIADQLIYQAQQQRKKSQQEQSLTQFDFK